MRTIALARQVVQRRVERAGLGPGEHAPAARPRLEPVDGGVGHLEVARRGQAAALRVPAQHLQHAAVREHQHHFARVARGDRVQAGDAALVEIREDLATIARDEVRSDLRLAERAASFVGAL